MTSRSWEWPLLTVNHYLRTGSDLILTRKSVLNSTDCYRTVPEFPGRHSHDQKWNTEHDPIAFNLRSSHCFVFFSRC